MRRIDALRRPHPPENSICGSTHSGCPCGSGGRSLPPAKDRTRRNVNEFHGKWNQSGASKVLALLWYLPPSQSVWPSADSTLAWAESIALG